MRAKLQNFAVFIDNNSISVAIPLNYSREAVIGVISRMNGCFRAHRPHELIRGVVFGCSGVLLCLCDNIVNNLLRTVLDGTTKRSGRLCFLWLFCCRCYCRFWLGFLRRIGRSLLRLRRWIGCRPLFGRCCAIPSYAVIDGATSLHGAALNPAYQRGLNRLLTEGIRNAHFFVGQAYFSFGLVLTQRGGCFSHLLGNLLFTQSFNCIRNACCSGSTHQRVGNHFQSYGVRQGFGDRFPRAVLHGGRFRRVFQRIPLFLR